MFRINFNIFRRKILEHSIHHQQHYHYKHRTNLIDHSRCFTQLSSCFVANSFRSKLFHYNETKNEYDDFGRVITVQTNFNYLQKRFKKKFRNKKSNESKSKSSSGSDSDEHSENDEANDDDDDDDRESIEYDQNNEPIISDSRTHSTTLTSNRLDGIGKNCFNISRAKFEESFYKVT